MVRNAYQGIGSEYETLLKAFDRENVNGIRQYKRNLLELYREYMDDYAKRVDVNQIIGSLKNHKNSYWALHKFISGQYGSCDVPLKKLDYALRARFPTDPKGLTLLVRKEHELPLPCGYGDSTTACYPFQKRNVTFANEIKSYLKA